MLYLSICWLADGTQVQPHSPIDSAVVSGVEGTDGEGAEPRDDEAGNYMYIKQLLIQSMYKYMHTMHTRTCTHIRAYHIAENF